MTMSARVLTIEDKLRQDPITIVSLDDFQYRDSDAIEPHVVLEQPTISLYCLDHTNHQAIFVETPPDVDLSTAPFYYQTQYQTARRLFAVSYDTLHALAQEVQLDPRHLILIYSVGRCGSTLVSQALNQADGVVSFSEPDVYTQILMLREADGSSDPEVSALVRSCTKIICAPTAQRGITRAWALKPRGFATHLADLFYRNFPEAKVIFLYRQAESWARSMVRAFDLFDPQMEQMLPQLQQLISKLDPLVAAYTAKHEATIAPIELLTCMWVSIMQRCLDLQQQGVPLFAVRYEELKAAPRAVLDVLFAYCEVAVSNVETITRVLAQDSQAGTSVSQVRAQQSKSELLEQHVAELHRLIRAYSTTITPDFIVPTTFRLTAQS
jgi:hypothetical protein